MEAVPTRDRRRRTRRRQRLLSLLVLGLARRAREQR
jgi:hypothetical protein